MPNCVWIGMCILYLSIASAQAADRPNIVYLMSDDQSTYTLGCYGNADVSTPNLDQLAAAGMVFDHHYDTTAICMASRATVMTGMYEYKHGCNFKHGELLTSTWQASYPILLRKAGYLTAFAGKFGFELRDKPGSPKRDLPSADFDRWGGGPGQTFYETSKNRSMAAYAAAYPHSTLSYGAFGRDFIRDASQQDKPFCLSISFKAPHRPTTPDPQFDAVYAGKTFQKPKNYGRQHGLHFSKQSKQGRQYVRFEEWGYSDNYDAVMATYHQQVYGIDVAVGMIRQALEEYGVAENTVILFTSDNGFFCGSHGYGSKVLPYEEASRVPLIVYDPRHPNSGRGLRCRALTGNIDIAPTILELAGLPAPASMDGADLMRLYENPQLSLHESLALINVCNQSGPPATHAMAVVTQSWKYIYWPYAAHGFEPTEELYHLANDPLELTNHALATEHQETLGTMREVYDRHMGAWKSQAVAYHNYQRYGVLFDRHTPWSEKRALLPKSH